MQETVDFVTFINDYAPTVLRFFLVILFPFSGLDKILNWPSAMKQAGGIFWPRGMLVASIAVEFLAPVCIVTGWHDRFAAFVLAGFCVITALLFHQFWRYPEFWRFKEGEGLQHFWEFLKNFGLVGGLGLVMLGPQTATLGQFIGHPFVSTQVCGPHAGRPEEAP
jgi:putative oxidoreductase